MNGSARLSGVGFRFPGTRQPVLADVTFEVPHGTTTVLLGPSGAGKSTLLRLMAGLLPLTTGHFELPPEAAGTVSVAMVFQDPRLLPWLTVRQNLEFALEAAGVPASDREARWRPLLRAVGLGEVADVRPSALSGGMAQRVGVVRALSLRPRMLLLDEPFGAVDPLLRDQLQAVLVRLLEREATTAVLVTHDVREAAVLADQVVVLAGAPATVVSTRAVLGPRPRDSLSDAVAATAREIRAELGAAVLPASIPRLH